MIGSGRAARAALFAAAIFTSSSSARAGSDAEDPEADSAARANPDRGDTPSRDAQVVLLNASVRLGELGSVDKLRRVLDARGLLREIPPSLAATLDGSSTQIADLDAIRDAYGQARFGDALRLVEENEQRILENAGGDPMPALAQLAQWRALIALGQDDRDGAIAWFRAAFRFNPAWSLDTAHAGPKVARLVKKARKEAAAVGELRVDADPATAAVQVDGGKRRGTSAPLALPAGPHLVTVTAAGRTSYAEVVEIEPSRPTRLVISLEKESPRARAARLLDATVAAPPGMERLRHVRDMSRFVGATRFLVIEDASPERALVRVYDVDLKKVSKQIAVDGDASSAAIARKVLAALDPGNMVDAGIVIVGDREGPRPWYQRWYVWAGVAAVAGGGVLGYHYATREPTSIRGF